MFIKKLAALAAMLVLTVTLVGCGAGSDIWGNELTKAGFTDSVKITAEVTDDTDTANSIIEVTATMMHYQAGAGDCRLHFVVRDDGRLYVVVPGSSSMEVAELVGDPSLALLKSDSRFGGCFTQVEPPES